MGVTEATENAIVAFGLGIVIGGATGMGPLPSAFIGLICVVLPSVVRAIGRLML